MEAFYLPSSSSLPSLIGQHLLPNSPVCPGCYLFPLKQLLGKPEALYTYNFLGFAVPPTSKIIQSLHQSTEEKTRMNYDIKDEVMVKTSIALQS